MYKYLSKCVIFCHYGFILISNVFFMSFLNAGSALVSVLLHIPHIACSPVLVYLVHQVSSMVARDIQWYLVVLQDVLKLVLNILL